MEGYMREGMMEGGKDGRYGEVGMQGGSVGGRHYSVTYFKLAAQFRCRCQNHNPAFVLETLAIQMKKFERVYQVYLKWHVPW